MKFYALAAASALPAFAAAPAFAQSQADPGVTAEVPDNTVYDGDFISVGIGAAYGPSYTGSDDYTAFVLPIVQASYKGIDFNPRPGGIAVDLIPDADEGPNLSAGPYARIRRDRVNLDGINDRVVEAYGELDMAIEVGGTVGVGFPAVLNPYDSLSANVDIGWDVNGAHGGMVIAPNITYFTPLSRGMAASLSVNTTYVDDDYSDYYYSVPETNTLLPAEDVLPGYRADGGFERAGLNLLIAYDLNGDLTDGGFSLVGLGGYSRLLGDAKNTPFTRLRGDADQFLIALGIGYTF